MLEDQNVLNVLKIIILEARVDQLSEKSRLRDLISPGILIFDGEWLDGQENFGFRHCARTGGRCWNIRNAD